MPAPRIVVVGSINMDLVIRCDHFPRPGETLAGGPFATFPGGKGANQAVAAARLGGKVSMVGCVGRDAYGQQLRAILEREHVNIDNLLQRGGVATGVGMILVDEHTGENSIITAAGANGEFFVRDILAPQCVETIEQAEVLVLQREVPDEVNLQAAEIARSAGVPVILNAAPAGTGGMSIPLLSLADLLIVNEIESRTIAGLDETDRLSHPIIAGHLRAMSGGHVCITLGAAGALYHDGLTIHECAAPAVDRVVDTTGAGDAFVGAFAVGWASAKDGLECLRFACAAGALAVTRPGAIDSLPTRAEVDGLLAMV